MNLDVKLSENKRGVCACGLCVCLCGVGVRAYVRTYVYTGVRMHTRACVCARYSH